MNIEFKQGPKDGERRVLIIGRFSDTVLVEMNGRDYLYRKTNRLTVDGQACIYQFISEAAVSNVA